MLNKHPQFRLSRGPWLPSTDEPVLAHGQRTFLWIDSRFLSVVSSDLLELKEVSVVAESDKSWRCFELPKSLDDSSSSVLLTCSNQTEYRKLRIPNLHVLPSRELTDQIERLLDRGEDDDANELLAKSGYPEEARRASQVAKLIDRHSEFVYQLTRSERHHGPYISATWDRKYARPVRRIRCKWIRIGERKVPPLALIVRLAEEIDVVLEEVCQCPRLILRRRRELEQAARIQQVDSGCIRWLGRQPGRTLAEKAGPHQRLLGVVRKEDSDTPENRVVRDLLQRCITAGEVYAARHREYTEHIRVVKVRDFVRLCERLLRHSPISQVRNLVGVAQPNYVLQQEARYSVLWNAYQRLVRQDKVTQSNWIWRDQLWNEWFVLAVISALDCLSARSPASRQRLFHLDEPETGRFGFAGSVGPWWLTRNGKLESLYLLQSGQLADCPKLPLAIKTLSPDIVLTSFEKQFPSYAIWTNLDVLSPCGTAKETAEQLAKVPARFNLNNWRMMIATGGGKTIETGEVAGIQWATFPLMLQDNISSWISFLRETIGVTDGQ